MDISLHALRRSDRLYSVEDGTDGFALIRKSDGDQAVFNALVRRIIDQAGSDFVALPRTDGHAGYDGVYIIPIED